MWVGCPADRPHTPYSHPFGCSISWPHPSIVGRPNLIAMRSNMGINSNAPFSCVRTSLRNVAYHRNCRNCSSHNRLSHHRARPPVAPPTRARVRMPDRPAPNCVAHLRRPYNRNHVSVRMTSQINVHCSEKRKRTRRASEKFVYEGAMQYLLTSPPLIILGKDSAKHLTGDKLLKKKWPSWLLTRVKFDACMHIFGFFTCKILSISKSTRHL